MSALPPPNTNIINTAPPPSDPSTQPAIKSEDIDVEMTMNLAAPAAPNGVVAPTTTDTVPNSNNNAGHVPPLAAPPAVVPTRKDRTLREFLDMMEEYAPIIPDAVTDYYLALSGLQTHDVRLKRLLALATQKFIADIAADAYQYSRIRQSSSNASGGSGGGAVGGAAGVGAAAQGAIAGGAAGGGGALKPIPRPGFGGGGGSGASGGRTVLTMEDLGSAVGEYGVNTRRPEFYR